MKSRRMPTWGDLFLLVASAACIVAVDKSSNRAVDVVAGLLLVVYLPGAALVSAFGAGRSRASVFEREMWIIGASFGLSVAGGLVLNLTSGLTRTYWLAPAKPIRQGVGVRRRNNQRIGGRGKEAWINLGFRTSVRSPPRRRGDLRGRRRAFCAYE